MGAKRVCSSPVHRRTVWSSETSAPRASAGRTSVGCMTSGRAPPPRCEVKRGQGGGEVNNLTKRMSKTGMTLPFFLPLSAGETGGTSRISTSNRQSCPGSRDKRVLRQSSLFGHLAKKGRWLMTVATKKNTRDLEDPAMLRSFAELLVVWNAIFPKTALPVLCTKCGHDNGFWVEVDVHGHYLHTTLCGAWEQVEYAVEKRKEDVAIRSNELFKERYPMRIPRGVKP